MYFNLYVIIHNQALAELRQLSQENLNDMRMRLEESEKRAICGQPTTVSDVISGAIEVKIYIFIYIHIGFSYCVEYATL